MAKKRNVVVRSNKTTKKKVARKIGKEIVKVEQKEVSALGKIFRGLGSVGGATLGSLIGAPHAGAAAGRDLAGQLSTWLGAGDYELKSNSLVDRFKSNGQIPAMHSSGQSVIIRHKEYIADVKTSSSANTLQTTSYNINPGLSTTFPWLSSIAQNFQEYSFKGLIFEYVSTSADALNSTNTALGTVMMYTNYRGTQATFNNKQQILNEYFSSDDKPSVSFCHPIECDPKENPYQIQYVRGAGVPSGEDTKTYDLGLFNIATTGMQGTSVVVGELWCTYEVELKKPIDISGIAQYSTYFHVYNTAGISTSNYFGTSPITQYGTDSLTVTGNSVTFPIGTYGRFFYWYEVVGTSTAWVGPTIAATTNVTYIGDIEGVTNQSSHAATSTQLSVAGVISITDPNTQAVLTWSGATLPTSPTTVDFYCIQLGVTNNAFA